MIKKIIHSDFKKYTIIRFTVIFAMMLQFTAIRFELFKWTQDAMVLGFLGLAEVMGSILGAFFSGQIADKFIKKRILIISFLLFSFVSILLFTITLPFYKQYFSINHIVNFVYILMFVLGLIRSVSGVASFTLLSKLIQKDDYKKAIALSSTAWQSGAVLGPLMGGILLAALNISTIEILSTILLLFSAFLIYSIEFKEKLEHVEKESFIKSFQVGVQFIFSKQIIWAALTLDLLAVLFGGAESLLSIFAQQILTIGEVGYGFLSSAHGIGSIVMLTLLSKYPINNKPGVKLILATICFGICIIGFGLSKWAVLSFVFLFFCGIFDAVSVVTRQSILQIKTPEHMKGRVAAVNSVFISSSNELGAFESGLTAKLMGTIPAVLFGGIMTIIVSIIMKFSAPKLEKMKL